MIIEIKDIRDKKYCINLRNVDFIVENDLEEIGNIYKEGNYLIYFSNRDEVIHISHRTKSDISMWFRRTFPAHSVGVTIHDE